MKLLVDMNLSPRWVDLFAGVGIEAVHWSTVGAKNAPDSDFSAILAASHGEKPSVVQIRAEDISPDAIGRQVVIALRQMSPELDEGALLTIDPNRTRLRVLPLG